VISSARFVLNPTTEVHAAYTYSRADYEEDNYADGLPLGEEFIRHAATAGATKKLSSNVTVGLRYAFFDYRNQTRGARITTQHTASLLR